MAVAITIDVEHPGRPVEDPIATLRSLLALAEKTAQPINWFVQGRWAMAYPSIVREFEARGDVVALHGHSHVDHRRLTAAGLRLEIQEGLEALRSIVPDTAIAFCRLPYGQGTDLPEVRAALEENRLTPVGWDYSSFDWDESLTDGQSATRLPQSVVGGGVVLLHSWPRRAPLILTSLLDALGSQKAVYVSELELAATGPQGLRMHTRFRDPSRDYSSPGES